MPHPQILKLTIAITIATSSAITSGCIDCSRIADDAQALVNKAVTCGAEDTCQVVSLYELAGPNTCLAAFQCPAAFRADVNLERFSKKARDLARDHKNCPMCVQASCPNSSEATASCNVEIGQCELSLDYSL
ncbi:MAG: hypothetical protein VX699_12940 [Myxococcota bacterium]|nr:hypothetical protein [Myxococcota bacterium]